MLAYIIRRLLLIIPTLFGVMLITFVIVQFTPGGPIERAIAELEGHGVDATARFSGSGGDVSSGGPATAGAEGQGDGSGLYRGRSGVDEDYIKELERQFGFDKPPVERFFLMMSNFLVLDFGESYFQGRPVLQIVLEKLPVSISLGLWTTLLTYCISIPLGIRKAVRDGTPFDVWTSGAVIIGYAIPSYMFAVLLIILFAGGTYLDLFPLRGLVSENFDELAWWQQILDYLHHIFLPVLAMVISGFAALTILTKNSFLDEISKQYVLTARAKGLQEGRILYRHVFRNAMLIIIAGFPAAFVAILFTGSLLIEQIFSLDGLGLLGFQSIIDRDYQIVFATLFVFTLIGLILNLITDLTYVLVDPRIDFEGRGA